MGMQLVIGGAFSGKRKLVRETSGKCSWVSAYKGDRLVDWETMWEMNTTLVMEGWESWISSELSHHENLDEIRSDFKALFLKIQEEGCIRNNQIILIMLEMGKGIVPLQKEERRLRDLAGWIAQDAANISDEVHLVWNGLSKRLK
jgi:adenosylcobinamide kinase / adenosylcobinamide-phosphate guanylyltransferase